MKTKYLLAFAWGSSAVAVLLGVIAWGQSFGWQFSVVNNYLLFPLLGLTAFGLMWSHYVTAALRQYLQLDKSTVKTYFDITSALVLGAILLHPGLLAYQLWADGLGLPPASTLTYVPSSKSFYMLIAVFSLYVFLAYELRHWFQDKSWWKYIQYLSDVAIILIFIHGLNLGSRLQQGWFQKVWYFYGITLLLSLGFIYYKKISLKPPKNN